MKERSDLAGFPFWLLLGPPLLPLLVVVAGQAGARLGFQVHGHSLGGLLTVVALLASTVVVLFVEAFAVSIALRELVRKPALRNFSSYSAVVVGFAAAIGALAWLLLS